jgi:ABC-type uncharacterized transport system permease subunit
VKGGIKIKKALDIRRVFYSIGLTLLIPYIPFTQKIAEDVLWLGFPYKFYAIHVLNNNFSIHFSIETFLLNVFIIYVIYTLILVLIDKLKKEET